MNKVTLDGAVIDFDAAIELMDDDLMERLHDALSPCSEQEFMDAYDVAHKQKFNEDFTVN